MVVLLQVSYGQNVITVQGKVVDSEKGTPLLYANVMLKKSLKGIITDTTGHFKLTHKGLLLDTLEVSFMGYETYLKPVFAGQPVTITIKLEPKKFQSKGVVIKGKKERYSRKNNPAVELIEKVIANKENNRLENNEYYQYDQHEIMQLAINNFDDSLNMISRFLKWFGFSKKYIAPSDLDGDAILPMYINENIFTKYYRKNPQSYKTLYRGNKTIFLHRLVDMEGMQTAVKEVFNEVNIYDNSIRLFSDEFMSPLSPLAPSFYKFFIMDTLEQNGIKCIDVSFAPRNMSDFGFFGSMFIVCDSTYAVKRLELRLPPSTGVNFVDELRIIQEFDTVQGKWCLKKDEVVANLSLIFENFASAHVRRSNTYNNYKFNQPQQDTLYSAKDEVINITEKTELFTDKQWDDSLRLRPLLPIESSTYTMFEELRDNFKFKALTTSTIIFTSNHIPFGGIEIGPWGALGSYNGIEGFRTRLGFRTNTGFHKKIFLSGYVAYGFNDKVVKYQGNVRYSFNEKKMFPTEYPRNSIMINYQFDNKMPGQSSAFGNPSDNFWHSFQGINVKKMSADYLFGIKYEYDISRKLYSEIMFENIQQKGLGDMNFNTISQEIKNLTTSQLFFRLRFSNETNFYESTTDRVAINSAKPIWTLSYNTGIKDFFGGDYDFHRLELDFYKLTFFSSYGYLKTNISAGKVWNPVPYPLLFVHQGNQSFLYKKRDFNMMNIMEFVSDQYVSAQFAYMSYGLILNRIPLINKLGWRESFSVKSVWGSISRSNLPEYNSNLMLFPTYKNGSSSVYSLATEPYLEASIGIYNIFKIGRIEFVRRFNYLNNPDVMKWSIRFGMLFGF